MPKTIQFYDLKGNALDCWENCDQIPRQGEKVQLPPKGLFRTVAEVKWSGRHTLFITLWDEGEGKESGISEPTGWSPNQEGTITNTGSSFA